MAETEKEQRRLDSWYQACGLEDPTPEEKLALLRKVHRGMEIPDVPSGGIEELNAQEFYLLHVTLNFA